MQALPALSHPVPSALGLRRGSGCWECCDAAVDGETVRQQRGRCTMSSIMYDSERACTSGTSVLGLC